MGRPLLENILVIAGPPFPNEEEKWVVSATEERLC